MDSSHHQSADGGAFASGQSTFSTELGYDFSSYRSSSETTTVYEQAERDECNCTSKKDELIRMLDAFIRDQCTTLKTVRAENAEYRIVLRNVGLVMRKNETTLRENAALISKLKSEKTKADTEWDARERTFRESVDKLTAEKAETEKRLQSHNAQHAVQLRTVEEQYKSRIERMTTEHNAAAADWHTRSENFTHQIEQLQHQHSASEAQWGAKVEEVKRTTAEEIQREYEARIVEIRQESEASSQQSSAQLQELQRVLDAATRDHQDAKRKWESNSNDFQKRIDALVDSNRTAADTWKARTFEFNKTIEEQKQAVVKVEKRLEAAVRDTTSEWSAKVQQLNAELATLRSQVDEHKRRTESEAKRHEETKRQLESLQGEKDAVDEKIRELQQSYDNLVQQTNAEIRRLKEQVDDYDRRLIEAKERLVTVSDDHGVQLDELRAQYEQRINGFEREKHATATHTRERVEALENHIKLLNEDRITALNDMEARRQKMQTEIDRISREKLTSDRCYEERSAEFEQQIKTLTDDLLQRTAKYDQQVKDVAAKYEQRIETIMRDSHATLTDFHSREEAYKSQLVDLQRQHTAATETLRSSSAELKRRIQTLEEEKTASNRDWQARLDEQERLAAFADATARGQSTELSRRLSEEKSKHEMELKEREQRISTLTGEKQHIETQLQSQSQEYERLVASLERERQSTREEREKFEALRLAHEDTLSESSSKTMEHQQAIASLQQQHSTAAKALQERLSTSEQLATKFKSRIGELEQQDATNAQAYAKGEAQWKSRFATLTKEMNDIARDKEESFKNWQRTTSGYEERVAEQQRSIDEAERLIARYKRDELKWASAADGHEHTIEGLRADIEEREQEITRLQQQREAADREWKQKLTDLQRQIVKLTKERDAMQQAMDDMQAQTADASSKSQTRINQVLRESASLIVKYDKRIEDWSKKYRELWISIQGALKERDPDTIEFALGGSISKTSYEQESSSFSTSEITVS